MDPVRWASHFRWLGEKLEKTKVAFQLLTEDLHFSRVWTTED